MDTTLEITDDSGFLALIDPDAYSGFVGADWTLGQMQKRIAREMAERHLLIWGTGQAGCWTVAFSFEPRQTAGILREVQGSIISSKGRLCVTNYESLTMAAQFSEVRLPEDHQADLVLSVKPGSYSCRIAQLSMVAHGWDQALPPEFLVELQLDPVLASVWERIPWAAGYLDEHL